MTGHKFRRPDKDRHTFKHLVKRVRYNDEIGLIERVGINYKGKVGNIKSTGYMRIKIDGIEYLYHHVVWMLCHKKWPVEIDHIDMNKRNNRINNLREVTRKENQKFKRVKCSAFLGGELVKTFDSITEAAQWANVGISNVYGAVCGGYMKNGKFMRRITAGGYRWRAA